METAIQVVWWIGLAGALLLTLPLLQAVVLVLRALRDIVGLGQRIQDAAEQVGTNVAVEAALASLLSPAGTIQSNAERLAEVVAELKQKMASAGAARPRRRG